MEKIAIAPKIKIAAIIMIAVTGRLTIISVSFIT